MNRKLLRDMLYDCILMRSSSVGTEDKQLMPCETASTCSHTTTKPFSLIYHPFNLSFCNTNQEQYSKEYSNNKHNEYTIPTPSEYISSQQGPKSCPTEPVSSMIAIIVANA